MENRADIKKHLEKQLHKANAFWSFDTGSCWHLSDRDLIRYVLTYLDLEDINRLFELYPKQQIKKIWLEELVPQGNYLISMNLSLALLYFDVKRPLQYLKSMETRHFKKIASYG